MEAIIVAVIGAVGVVLASLFQSMRKENREDHALVTSSLSRIETKLDGHIDNHAQGVYSPEPTKRKDPPHATRSHKKRPGVDDPVSKKGRSTRA